MKQAVLLSSLLSLFIVAPAVHAQQIIGQAYWYNAYNTFYYAGGFQLKVCKADASYHPTGQCSTTTLDQYGNFNFNAYYGTGYYFVYLWRDDYYVGSDSYPTDGPAYVLAGQSPNYWQGTLATTPRALPPQRVYPGEGQVNTPTSFTLQWTDGENADRARGDWPITYDIYASGNEFPENLVFSNIPCNGVGTCSVSVSGLAYTTRYQWRVVARMHSGKVVPGAGSDNSYLTSSSTFHFSTAWDPATPTHTITSINGNYLKAAGGGGGSFDATGSSSTYETQFKLVNANGGSTLYSGDQVYIQTNRNYYASATNGGGDGVTAIPAWTMGYERWTIERVAGFGPINSGDQVDLKSYYNWYMTAEGGGGGAVNANRTSVGPWETFTFH